LSCHSVAVVLTLVQTKQIGINIHKRNITKNTVQKIKNKVNTSTHTTKTPTHIHNALKLQNPHIHTRTSTDKHTHTDRHITKQVKTKTVQILIFC